MNNCPFITLAFLLVSAAGLHAQDAWWRETFMQPDEDVPTRLHSRGAYRTFRLDSLQLMNTLRRSPANEGITMELPRPDGGRERFRVFPAPVMTPKLARKYPKIRTYAGHSIDHPNIRLHLDWTPHGLHAMVLQPQADFFIDPISSNEKEYLVYYRKDLKTGMLQGCATAFREAIAFRDDQRLPAAIGDTLHLFRLAVAATGGYTRFHGGTVEQALSAIVTSIHRVNAVYERDLAVRLVLVEGNDKVIFTDPETDPYTRNNQKNQNQQVLDERIGEDNYDIGHVFGIEGDSRAEVGSACVEGEKAMGSSLSENPTGDPFNVDLIAHEIGHQLGATHTFNYCFSGFQGEQPFEPGSGSTIMGWAGLCDENNLQPNSDAYFHGASIQEIATFISNGAGRECAVREPIGNAMPAARAGDGGWTIPAGTPFELTGGGADADADLLTFAWEEIDAGPAVPVQAPLGTAPLFRSWPPTIDSVRVFPRRAYLLDNQMPLGETLPDYSRPLTFLLTVRDQRGGVAWDSLALMVTEEAGPFRVTSLNEPGRTLTAGSTIEITWDAARTDRPPVGVTAVDLLLSTDGGQTFPLMLAAGLPNSGTATILLPDTLVGDAFRLMVKAVGNVFFDVNDYDFSIDQSSTASRQPVWEEALFRVYPNPAAEQVWVEMEGPPSSGTLFLWSPVGQLLKVIEMKGSKMRLNVEGLPAGLYFLEWRSGESRWVRLLKK